MMVSTNFTKLSDTNMIDYPVLPVYIFIVMASADHDHSIVSVWGIRQILLSAHAMCLALLWQTTINHSFNSKTIFLYYFYFLQYYTKDTGRVILLKALMSSQGTCSTIRSSMIHSKCVVLYLTVGNSRVCRLVHLIVMCTKTKKDWSAYCFFLESSKLFHLLWRGGLHSS